MRLTASRAGERNDELRSEPQPVRIDRRAQLSDDVDICETAHQTGIVGLVHLDPVSAPILRGFAGCLGRCQGVHHLTRRGVQQRDADANRHV